MRSLVAIPASLVFLTFAEPASTQSRNAEGYLFLTTSASSFRSLTRMWS